MEGRRAADENDLGAAAVRGFGQRVAHLAAGAVAEEADGVESLARAAGGDEHDFAGQIVAAAKSAEDRAGDGLGLGHAARAHHAAGQLARSRLDDAHAALAEDFEVGLRGRMLPHVHVHGGGDQDRRRRGQVEGGEEVVGNAVGELGQDVGRGGGDDQRVGPLRLADVLDAVLFGGGFVGAVPGARVVPQAGDDLVAGERGEGERLDESRGRPGHDHMDLKSLALQGAHQFRRFIRGNSAGDAHGDSHGSIVAGFGWGRRGRRRGAHSAGGNANSTESESPDPRPAA